MAIQHHDDVEVDAGDDWVILGNLFQVDGTSPLDLSNATLEWVLIDVDGNDVLNDQSDGVELTKLSPATAGHIQISVTDAVTALIPAGGYIDALRVVSSGLTSTVWVGNIAVNANPFEETA